MASVPLRDFGSTATLDRVLAKHNHSGLRYRNPETILLTLEAEAEQACSEALPASRSALIRHYINQRLNSLTR